VGERNKAARCVGKKEVRNPDTRTVHRTSTTPAGLVPLKGFASALNFAACFQRPGDGKTLFRRSSFSDAGDQRYS